MNKKLLLATFIGASFSLSGCGSSSNDDNNSSTGTEQPAPSNPSIPTTPVTPSDPTSDKEKTEAQQIAAFFLHAITAETLNKGLIDRLFYLQEYMLDDEADNLDCYKKTVISGSTFTLTKECTVPYDAGSSFKGLSGSFSESGDPESSTGLNTKLSNLKIDVDGAVFTADGTLNIKDSANTETHSTNDLVISSEATGNKFYFKNFTLKNTETSSAFINKASGELTVTDKNGQTLYAVSFDQDSDWSTLAGNTYPTLGKLKVQFKNDSTRYLTLTALTNKDNATYYAQAGTVTLEDNVTKAWKDIIISPAKYKLP